MHVLAAHVPSLKPMNKPKEDVIASLYFEEPLVVMHSLDPADSRRIVISVSSNLHLHPQAKSLP